jgi:hypothetical protein
MARPYIATAYRRSLNFFQRCHKTTVTNKRVESRASNSMSTTPQIALSRPCSQPPLVRLGPHPVTRPLLAF